MIALLLAAAQMPGMTMPHAPAPSAAPKAATRRRARTPAHPHAGHAMAETPGMAMPQATPPPAPADPHAGHDMTTMPAMAMPGMAMPATTTGEPPTGTDLPPGNAPAPTARPGLAAAGAYDPAAMAQAAATLRRDHGGMIVHQILFNLAEVQVRDGRDGYRWDGEAWIGGDIDRFTLKSEGEGGFGGKLSAAEMQALYSHALDPYWNLQAGLRHDIAPGSPRTYATLSVEGLAPYWFEVEGALFLSDKGDILARAEVWYDERITRYLVLQPRMEANLSAQGTPATRLGSGLTDLELGLRLRYEKSRALAPYVGVSWERQYGGTARLAHARGDDTGGVGLVAGVRAWF